MGNNLELDIIRIFNRDPTLILSIHQISKKLGKSYPHIHAKVNSLIKERILRVLVAGRSNLCSINLESEKALLLLSLNEIYLRERSNKDAALLALIDQIKREFLIYTVIRHSSKTFFILDHIYDGEAIKNKYPGIKKYFPVFLTRTDFFNFVLHDPTVLKNKVVLFSAESYYKLLQAIEPNIRMLKVSE